jgi:hypothetical protein
MKQSFFQSAEVVAWLTPERFERLGETREQALKRACDTAPNAATAAIWTLQLCCIIPSEEDLKRWSAAVSTKPTFKPRKS